MEVDRGRWHALAVMSKLDVIEVASGTEEFEAVLGLADEVLDQRRYIVSAIETASKDCVLGAFDGSRCLGFLRFYVQVVGSEEGRPPVMRDGSPLTEGFVEAFGVDPEARRMGIGSALQAKAQELCRACGCYQIRSRSPISSSENYALKLTDGYVLHPSNENDSYYFSGSSDCSSTVSSRPPRKQNGVLVAAPLARPRSDAFRRAERRTPFARFASPTSEVAGARQGTLSRKVSAGQGGGRLLSLSELASGRRPLCDTSTRLATG
jgi:ribosomal protein S18 acetylase RimI-like enzyme